MVIFFLLLIIIPVLLISGCADNISGVASDKIPPTIAVYTPKSGDSIIYGKIAVNYGANDDQGLKYIDIYIYSNGTILRGARYNYTNGTLPSIYLDIDSAWVGSKISYLCIAADLNGNLAYCDTMKNLSIYNSLAPPSAPLNLSAYLIPNSRTINISWNDTAKFAKGYELQKRVGFNGTWIENYELLSTGTFNTNDPSADTSLANYYRIRAYNDFGKSSFSNVSSNQGSGSNGSLQPPTDLSATAFSTNKVGLRWIYNTSSVTVTKFYVERKLDYESDFSVIGMLLANTTSYQDSVGLSAGKAYVYRIKVFSRSDSAWSKEVNVVTLSSNLIIAPTDLVVIPNTTTINISWKDASIYSTGYELWKKVGINGTWSLLKNLAPKTFNTNDVNVDTTLNNYYKIRSSNAFGYSDFSAEAAYIGSGYSGNVKPPTNLTVNRLSAQKISLSWTDNTSNETKFVVERTTQYFINFVVVKVLPLNTISFIDSIGISANTPYYYRVKVFTETDSAASAEVGVTAITKPTALAITKVSAASLKLTWSEQGNFATATDVERKSLTNTSYVVVGSIAAFTGTMTDSQLTPGETYTYRLRAKDLVSYSDYSDEFTIKLTVPAKVVIDEQIPSNKNK